MAISTISRRSPAQGVTWDLDRRSDTLVVGFQHSVSEGWSELFEAMKGEVAAGVRFVVFSKDIPRISPAGMAIFRELVRYLIGAGWRCTGQPSSGDALT